MNRLDTPFNVSILEITPERLKKIQPVTSLDIYESVGGPLHEDGLFSLKIFGRIGDPSRDGRFAYIDVKVPIFHPFIYRTIVKLKGLYGGILTGQAYAVWNDELKDFESSNEIDGQTGFRFFMRHFKDIQYKENKSDLRSARIALIKKFVDRATTTKVLVLPAGLRDIETDDSGRTTYDEINDIYSRLLSISRTVVETEYDDIGPSVNLPPLLLQRAFNELYEYIERIITGKKGFIQKKWGSRRVFNGTRNVITAMDTSTAVLGAPNAPKFSDTVVGLYQQSKAILPKSIHALRYGYLPDIFAAGANQGYLVNPKTLESELVELRPDDYDRFNSTEGLEKVISSYGEVRLRDRPVRLGKKGHYLALVYTGPDMTFKVFSDIRDLPADRDRKDVRPITLAEFIYLSGYKIWNNDGAFVTRYPVTGIGSSYPSTVYTKTTTRGEVRRELGPDWEPLDETHTALEYPILNPALWLDAQVIPTARVEGMGADFDGDMCNFTSVYSEEGVAEIVKALNSKRAFIDPRGGMNASVDVQMVKMVLHNITSTPKSLAKS